MLKSNPFKSTSPKQSTKHNRIRSCTSWKFGRWKASLLFAQRLRRGRGLVDLVTMDVSLSACVIYEYICIYIYINYNIYYAWYSIWYLYFLHVVLCIILDIHPTNCYMEMYTRALFIYWVTKGRTEYPLSRHGSRLPTLEGSLQSIVHLPTNWPVLFSSP